MMPMVAAVCLISIFSNMVSSQPFFVTNGSCEIISYGGWNPHESCPTGYGCYYGSGAYDCCVQTCLTPGTSSGCLTGAYCSGIGIYQRTTNNYMYACVYGSLITPNSCNPVSTSTCASGYLYQDLNCYCTSDTQCSSYRGCSTSNGFTSGNICLCTDDVDCIFRDYCAGDFCASCAYPFMFRNCEGICLNVPWYINLSFGLLFGVGYFLAIYFTESSTAMRLAMVFLFSIPSLDVISDVLYVSTTIFNSTTLFGFCVFFLVLPTCLFIRHLKMRGMRPKWYILKPPPFGKSDLNTIFQIDHSSFYTVFYCSLRIPILILWAGI